MVFVNNALDKLSMESKFQSLIQSPIKYLGWSFLQKYLMTFS